ncbi:MAG: terminase [Methylobacterium mesophilicum]|nr:terminase [Methylobacterium mesophilicum]
MAQIDLEEPTRPQLAALFGYSSRWIGELRSKGDLPSDGASLLENIEAWAQMKYGVDPDADPDALDKEQQQARLAKEQADSKAMDNAERRKELASLPDMTAVVVGLITLAVSRLQQVPALIAKGDNRLRQRIERAINDALNELSMTGVEKAMGGGMDEEEEDPASGGADA